MVSKRRKADRSELSAILRKAKSYSRNKQYHEAELLLHDFISDIEGQFGGDAPELIDLLYSYAQAVSRQHPWDCSPLETTSALKRALGIATRLYGEGSPRTIPIHETLAVCLGASGELTSAVEHMTIVVHFKEQAHGQGTLLAHALNGLADMHLRLGHYVEAAGLYERAFDMAGRRGDDIMDQAIWYGRGRALIGMGRFAEALAPLEQAYSWAFHRYGENNRLTIEYRSLLDRARHGVQNTQIDE